MTDLKETNEAKGDESNRDAAKAKKKERPVRELKTPKNPRGTLQRYLKPHNLFITDLTEVSGRSRHTIHGWWNVTQDMKMIECLILAALAKRMIKAHHEVTKFNRDGL